MMSNKLLLIKLMTGCFLALALTTAQADTIFTDDFEDGNINGWSGNTTINYYSSGAFSNYSLRVGKSNTGTASISTAGYTNVNTSLQLAAYGLDRNEVCYAEISTNGGSNWTSVLSVANGQDNSTLYSYSGSIAGSDNNANFQIRIRGASNRNSDYCYLDNIIVTGSAGSPEPEITVSGSGAFGNVNNNATGTQTITVNNDGNADLDISSVNGLGFPFSISNNGCNTVSAGASCEITLEFSPIAVGSYGDTLTITSNDADETNTYVSLNGTGVDDSTTCTYDCLSGDGNVSRSSVTYSNLTGSAGNGSLVDFSAFAVPPDAADPSNTFEGSLVFNSVQRGWVEIHDPYLYKTLSDVKQLPDFNYEFVQHGTHIIPVTRGLIEKANKLGEWDLILEPGRVWDENSDNGFSRASIPFALTEFNQNCTHNGVLTFLFKDNGDMSKVQYQIASETCNYYQFNMYGRLTASYILSTVNNAAAIKTDYEIEVANRMVTKPISELAVDYPGAGINVSNIGSDQSSPDMTLFGVSYNGVHYTGGCETRYGTYPFCDVMSLPSYSTAKSVVGAMSLMRLEQKYAGSQQYAIVRDYVSECSNNSKWGSVTLENVIDMATGNYDSAAYEADEANDATTWLYNNTHSGKVGISCDFYAHKVNSGTTRVYHSSDTYLVGLAVDEYYQTQEGNSNLDFFSDMLVQEVFEPLGVSPSMNTTIRTRDNAANAVSGLGLTYHRDDIIKIANMLNSDNGMINGVQVLDAGMVNAGLQRNSNDRGLSTGTSTGKYNNSFWAHELSASPVMDNCSSETWIPYMSGYGGIGIQMLPNGMIYYFFSDGLNYASTKTLNELDKISSLCN
ncbi:MAG: choice-of-anchor D domain-containing protein [Alteromonadaceae bacterium]|nr:choice-of-anchor D domain-containing protein [Alteromonadaceae bacterium]